MRIFGFEIRRNTEDNIVSIGQSLNPDGAVTIDGDVSGYSQVTTSEAAITSESELVAKYRNLAIQAEIQQAIEEIANEAISVDSRGKVVEIVLDEIEGISDKLKKKIIEEFERILQLLDFSNSAYEIFTRWYIDGRLNYEIVIDHNNLKRGIIALRYIDPRKLRLVREMEPAKREDTTAHQYGAAANAMKRVKNEYYVYSEQGFSAGSGNDISGVKISKDSIARATSGIMDPSNTMVLSWLQKSIKPFNSLRLLEDARVIYTYTRAPERRVFYINVGNLPKVQAEQHLNSEMAKYKNKIAYDQATGEIRSDRRFMTMTEDLWFARRGGERATEIDTLPAGQAMSGDEDLNYFNKKLYKSLGVPSARLEPETMYAFGRPSEMSREEIKFAKFIRRLRSSFSNIFDEILERQLILKGIIRPEDWSIIKNGIRYDFMSDSYFEKLKETEIIKENAASVRELVDQIGTFYSIEYIRRKVLFMSDEDIKEMDAQINAEKKQGLYKKFGIEDDAGVGESGQDDVDDDISDEELGIKPENGDDDDQGRQQNSKG